LGGAGTADALIAPAHISKSAQNAIAGEWRVEGAGRSRKIIDDEYQKRMRR